MVWAVAGSTSLGLGHRPNPCSPGAEIRVPPGPEMPDASRVSGRGANQAAMTAVLSLSPLLFVQDIARRGVDAGDRSVRHGRSGVRAPAGDQPQNPDAHNARGTTFVWTATADQILANVARGRVALEKVSQL